MHTIENELFHYLKKGEDFLRQKGIQKPRLEAQLIFSHILGLERYQLYTQFERPLDRDEIKNLRELLIQRGEKKPIAYILKQKEFYSRNFLVNSSVLIPRPETEELVQLILNEFSNNHSQKKTILDVGTGSGVIGLTLSLEIPDIIHELILTDISDEALNMARDNYERLKNDNVDSNVRFFKSNLFSSIPESYQKSIDLIVSNPPYVTRDEYEGLEKDVKNYEPIQALLVDNVSEFFTHFFCSVKKYLHPTGSFFLETSPMIIQEQIEIARNCGMKYFSVRKDYSGKDRFLIFRNDQNEK